MGMMRNINKTMRTETGKEKNAEPKKNKEEEIEKNEEILILELQSKDNEKKLKQLGKQTITRNRQLRNKQRTKI